MKKNNLLFISITIFVAAILNACLPPSDPYPNAAPSTVVAQAQVLSDSLESYIYKWVQGQVGDSIPDNLIPQGISDSKNFYLKNPDSATAAETWAVRYAKPINKDSLLAGIPEPRVTYLFLGTALAPFGSKLVVEGQFPHCRFFTIQCSPPLNGKEYYAQRQFGTAEVAMVDADIDPLPGHTNPFRVGANRNATNRSYHVEFDLCTGDPVALNGTAHIFPYRSNSNIRKGAMMTYQGPLGFKTLAGTALPVEQQGNWNLGALWIRIYEPDDGTGALGGVSLPKVYFQLPTGEKYFIGSNFSALVNRANATIANRVVVSQPNANYGPSVGWMKSWGITRSILNGICISNGWSRPDSGARVNAIDLGWTGRSEFQPAPGNMEPHATTNNYASYLGRDITVPPGMVAVLTGKLPTFPVTRNGNAVMTAAQVRYWSIIGVDEDWQSPMPATTVHCINDDEVLIDAGRNYVIAYSRTVDKPNNATTANGVSWVDWGTQSDLGVLIRWVCVSPEWSFSLAPQENHLDWAHSDWAGSLYDSTLIGENWRNGFMKCYLPRVHYMTKAEFETLGNNITAETVPVWVDSSYTKAGAAESQLGTITVSSVADTLSSNAGHNLIDGNMNTFWSSLWGVPNVTAVIDLGSVKKISAIKLNWDWIFFGKDYTLKVSDNNTTWTNVATATNENGQVDIYKNLQGVSGRYVKLDLTNYNIGYYRLAEFEVFTSDCDCTAPPLGIDEPSGENFSFSLFPNPATNVLNIQANLIGKYVIQIYNIQGKLFFEKTLTTANSAFDIMPLPVGVYFAVLVTDKQKAVRKFIRIK
jgi:hypothetical protein